MAFSMESQTIEVIILCFAREVGHCVECPSCSKNITKLSIISLALVDFSLNIATKYRILQKSAELLRETISTLEQLVTNCDETKVETNSCSEQVH